MASHSTRSRKPPPEQQLEPQPRARWTLSLTRIFADLMVDQVHKGNTEKKSLSKQAWKNIYDNFHKKTGYNWDIEQLKNKYIALRKQYAVVKALLDQDDFKWDETTGVITATDEAWDKYIEEHPDSENLRIMGCPLYKQLCIIFSIPEIRDKYTGSDLHEQRLTPSTPCLQNSNMLQDDPVTTESEEINDTADEKEHFQLDDASRSIPRKRGRRGVDDVIAEAILDMAASSKLKAQAIRKFNEKFSITDCVRALDELQGVDEQLYYAALDLFDNRIARETFLSLKTDKRLTWLNGKCLLQTISSGSFNF